jgi:hypothetical protein
MSQRALILCAALASLAAGCDGGSASASAPDGSPPPPEAAAEASAPAPSQIFSETCLATEPPGHSVRTLTGNNAAELTGGTLGSRDVIVGPLRKPVTIAVREPSTRLTLGPAFLIRSSESSEYVALIATVTNAAGDYLCSARAQNLRWLAADGTQLAKTEVSYVQGSVGDVDGIYLDTCLGPGEIGYLFELETGEAAGSPLFEAASVELTLSARGGATPAPGALRPTAYVPCKDGRQFEVAFENSGSTPVRLWDDVLGVYFLVDDEGPVSWGYLWTRRGLGIYGPGKVTVGGAANFYPGAITRMHVFARFDDPTGF